jgi:hypothetical protein
MRNASEISHIVPNEIRAVNPMRRGKKYDLVITCTLQATKSWMGVETATCRLYIRL